MSIKCPECGEPNGIENPPAIAAPLARMIRCDSCDAAMQERRAKATLDDRDAQHAKRVLEVLPKGLREMRFATSPAPAEAIKAAEAWARSGGRLVLTGPVGTGKTGLAAAAVWTRLYAKPIAWVSVPTLMANLSASFDSEDRKRALSQIKGKRSIALDDLDKFKPSEWAASNLFAAIDNAMTGNADLIVTTNKTPGEIADFIGGSIGDAIASRLASCRVVSVGGSDHRIQAAA